MMIQKFSHIRIHGNLRKYKIDGLVGNNQTRLYYNRRATDGQIMISETNMCYKTFDKIGTLISQTE